MPHDAHMPGVDCTPKGCCANLRCKSMYYRNDERPGSLHDESAMGYWCRLTSEGIGPDRDGVSHTDCQSHRSCFSAAYRSH